MFTDALMMGLEYMIYKKSIDTNLSSFCGWEATHSVVLNVLK